MKYLCIKEYKSYELGGVYNLIRITHRKGPNIKNALVEYKSNYEWVTAYFLKKHFKYIKPIKEEHT